MEYDLGWQRHYATGCVGMVGGQQHGKVEHDPGLLLDNHIALYLQSGMCHATRALLTIDEHEQDNTHQDGRPWL